MPKPFKPMLAGEADLAALRYPVLASPKLDGIRAIIIDGRVMSRSLKPIPNKNIQKRFGHKAYEGLDGELIVGSPTSKTCYRDTVSQVMAHDKECSATYYIFDSIRYPKLTYMDRLMKLEGYENIVVLEQCQVDNEAALLAYESACLELGYEGLILRDPKSLYKLGRSSTREGILLKLKRFVDAEAVVMGFEERMHNGNEAKTNELGRTARSSHKDGMVPMGTLGALVVKMDDIDFNIGTGFDDTQRLDIWQNRMQYIGKLAKFKYFPVGMKVAPRHPVFLGWRDARDL